MGNLGGGEILVILLLGLLVIGPQRLPVVARQIGRLLTQIRQMSRGFQEEFRTALEDPTIEATAKTRAELHEMSQEFQEGLRTAFEDPTIEAAAKTRSTQLKSESTDSDDSLGSDSAEDRD